MQLAVARLGGIPLNIETCFSRGVARLEDIWTPRTLVNDKK